MAFLAIFRSVAAKIVTVPITAFVVGLLIPGLLAYNLMQHGVERDLHEKARNVLDLLSAVDHYAEETSETAQADKTSIPHLGASVTKQVIKRYEKDHSDSAFLYRRVVLNPTDPHNQADAYETGLIHWFSANPTRPEAEAEIQQKGQRYHVLAVPVTVSQDRCLHCHGSLKAAPAWRIKEFGKTAGYGWQKGQVVGANLVYIPSDYPHREAATTFWAATKSVGVLALTCAIVLMLRAHFLIARPVRRMLAASQAIRQGEWREWTDARFPDELAELGSAFYTTVLWLRERVIREEKLRALFQQFIPASVAAKALGKDADEILVGTRHSVTVMIINIRNFKLLMDHLPPDQTVTTLNEYFSEVNRIIVANKGLVSKYMGDSVMALFGMPLTQENHALGAVRAALSLPAALQNLYVRLDEKYGWELGVGIGISTGEPIVGSFGSSEHREYTVLGDVVREAHALEAATKNVPEEDSIVISEATYRSVMSDVHVFDLGDKPGVNGATLHAYAVQGFRAEIRTSRAA